MIIYRLTDRIPVQIGEVKFWISPLSFDHKMQLGQAKQMRGGEEVLDAAKFAYLSVKFGVKEVEGLNDFEGKPYELGFDPDGSLSNDCVAEIISVAQGQALRMAATALAGEIKEHELPGVKIDLKGVRSSKKKEPQA